MKTLSITLTTGAQHAEALIAIRKHVALLEKQYLEYMDAGAMEQASKTRRYLLAASNAEDAIRDAVEVGQ